MSDVCQAWICFHILTFNCFGVHLFSPSDVCFGVYLFSRFDVCFGVHLFSCPDVCQAWICFDVSTCVSAIRGVSVSCRWTHSDDVWSRGWGINSA